MAIVQLMQSDSPAPVEPASRPPTEHQLLSEAAARWVRLSHRQGGHGCTVAITEGFGSYDGERPDVIGWRNAGHLDGSVVVEAKTSRADYLADRLKFHRRFPAEGVGRWRYYICPPGLIEEHELPPGWGLLWHAPRTRVRVIAGAALALPTNGPPDTDGVRRWNQRRVIDAFARFAFEERAVERELAMLAKLVQRIADPDALTKQLRLLQNSANANRRTAAMERQRVERLQAELAQLRASA